MLLNFFFISHRWRGESGGFNREFTRIHTKMHRINGLPIISVHLIRSPTRSLTPTGHVAVFLSKTWLKTLHPLGLRVRQNLQNHVHHV